MVDLTLAAIPVFFGTMGAEYAWQRAHADERGELPSDYERNDTLTSLGMGVGSLVVPLVASRAVEWTRFERQGKYVMAGVAAAGVAVTAADAYIQASDRRDAHSDEAPLASNQVGRGASTEVVPAAPEGNRRWRRMARKISSTGAAAAVAGALTAASTTWAAHTMGKKLFEKRVVPDLGTGPLTVIAATVGWDFIYYWNHRFMHEVRWLWAVHVVHHSSERYNLSTALRQPVGDTFGMFVPYGALSLLGIRPEVTETARGINLLYQYWIHTDAIDRLPDSFERVFNTASHHRVHHGANPQYIDKNYGSILICWDRWFGSFEPEDEPVRYGLTKNIDTYNPAKVMFHEFVDILRDVADSRNWGDRLSFVFRGPGWAYEKHAELGDLERQIGGEAAPAAA